MITHLLNRSSLDSEIRNPKSEIATTIPSSPANGHRMNKQIIALIIALTLALGASSGQAATRTWNNSGTNFNAGASWGGTAPGVADRAAFNNSAVTQPKLSASIAILTLSFEAGSSGYDITNTTTEVLTLSQNGAGGAVTTAAIFANNTSGTNTVSAPILLSNAANTSIAQNASGGTLVLNGVISSTNAISVNFIVNGASSLVINNANNYSGPTSLAGGTLASNPVINIGNNAAFSTGTVSVVNGINIAAFGAARNVANSIIWGGNGIISGSNALTFSGNFTNSGSASRTLTLNNSALTTLSGNVFLSELAGTGRNLTIDGTGAGLISGVIANFNGAGTASGFTYSGSNTLTLSGAGANTYSGATKVNSGELDLNKTAGVDAIAGGGLTVGDNIGAANSAITLLKADNQINNASGVTVNSDGKFDIAAQSDTVGTVILAGGTITGTTGVLTGTSYDVRAGTVSGHLGGSGVVLTKSTVGTVILSSSATYTGGTAITGGTLQLNANNVLPDTGTVTLGGGTLQLNGVSEGTTATAGAGALALSSNSIIDLTSTSLIHFLASNGQTWTGTLSIYNWSGTPVTGGGAEQILFGSDTTSLTQAQLDAITFYSDSGVTSLGTAMFATVNDGEIVPTVTAVPEPSTWLAGALVFASLLVTQRQRLARRKVLAVTA